MLLGNEGQQNNYMIQVLFIHILKLRLKSPLVIVHGRILSETLNVVRPFIHGISHIFPIILQHYKHLDLHFFKNTCFKNEMNMNMNRIWLCLSERKCFQKKTTLPSFRSFYISNLPANGRVTK